MNSLNNIILRYVFCSTTYRTYLGLKHPIGPSDPLVVTEGRELGVYISRVDATARALVGLVLFALITRGQLAVGKESIICAE